MFDNFNFNMLYVASFCFINQTESLQDSTVQHFKGNSITYNLGSGCGSQKSLNVNILPHSRYSIKPFSHIYTKNQHI